jgi:prepilin signal peptidase PulO-like enzyme (type II secretory pathway)
VHPSSQKRYLQGENKAKISDEKRVMLIILFSILMGAVIGSFLNVVIFRLPKTLNGEKISLSFPASFCPACHHPIRWRHNIPVISWLLLKGKCLDCRSAISPRYPLIEILMAALFGWVTSQHGLTADTAAVLFALCLLVPLAVIDADTMLLPNRLMYPLLAGGLTVALAGIGRVSWQEAAIAAALGFVAPWSISKLFYLFNKREGMGRGDMKLFAAIGAWVGYSQLWDVMIASCILATVCALLILKVKRGQSFPFGPYPIIVTVIIFLFN